MPHERPARRRSPQTCSLQLQGWPHAPGPSSVNRLFRRGSGEGVRIEIDNEAVSVDLHLVLEKDTNVRDVSRKVQENVARAIEDIVGMQVTRIDVHIEDIDYT